MCCPKKKGSGGEKPNGREGNVYSRMPRPLYPDLLECLLSRSDLRSSRSLRTSSISLLPLALEVSERSARYLRGRLPSIFSSTPPSSPERRLMVLPSTASLEKPILTPRMIIVIPSSSMREPAWLAVRVLTSLSRLLSVWLSWLSLSLNVLWLLDTLRSVSTVRGAGLGVRAAWYSSASRCFCSKSLGGSSP